MATAAHPSDLEAAGPCPRFLAMKAQHAELAREIAAASGCSEDAASIAAGSYINCRNMPDFGLSDPPYGWYARHTDALIALRAWLRALEASVSVASKNDRVAA